MTPQPTPEQIEKNKAHAKEHGFYLLCNGRYSMELDREWDSILRIVPHDYSIAWSLEDVDLESLALEQAQDHYESMREGMD